MTRIPRPADHTSEIGLLALIATGVMYATIRGIDNATSDDPFDPSAYLVVLTLIVGAIKERWTQRSVDRMGQHVADSAPVGSGPTEVEVVNPPGRPANVKDQDA